MKNFQLILIFICSNNNIYCFYVNNKIDTFLADMIKKLEYSAMSQGQKNIALRNAVQKKECDDISLLLQKGANPTDPNEKGITAMMYAANTGKSDVFEKFKNYKNGFIGCDKNQRNILMFAASGGNVEIINICCKEGVDIKAKSAQYWTPLMFAVYQGRAQAMFYFIQHGLSIDDKTKSGESMFQLGLYGNNPLVLDTLVKLGAPLDIVQEEPLIFAAKKGKLQSLRWLLATNGYESFQKDKNGATVLMHCLDNNYIESIPDIFLYGNKKLLCNQKDTSGFTALDIGQACGSFSATNALRFEKYGEQLIDGRVREIITKYCEDSIPVKKLTTKETKNNIIHILRERELRGFVKKNNHHEK